MIARRRPRDGFTITRAKLAWVAAIAAAIGATWAIWAPIRDFWVTAERFRAHQRSDMSARDWTRYGLANSRLEHLQDKAYECDAKRSAGELGAKADAVICAHYRDRIAAVEKEVEKLRARLIDAAGERIDEE